MNCSPDHTIDKSRYSSTHRIVCLFFFIVGFFIYANTFDASIHYDDHHVFANRDFDNFLQERAFTNTRYVANLTFAFNQWLSGPEVFSYHMVNLIIHVCSAFLVYQLLFQILCFPGNRRTAQRSSLNKVSKFALPHLNDLYFWPAFFGGLIFLIHPLGTQAVTYLTQRNASLATLFYIASIVSYLQARRITLYWQPGRDKIDLPHPFFRPRHLCWYSLSVMTAVLAMYTKEQSLTLPAVLVLIEFFFVQPNLENAGKRALYLLPLLATGLIIPYHHLPFFHPPSAPGDVARILPSWGQDYLTRSTYFLSQLGVIWNIYLKLLVLPHGQSIDHDFFVSDSLLHPITLGAFIGLLGLTIIAVLTLKRYRLVAFSIVWFLVTVSVTSSVIPNMIFVAEHRVYLPMVGLSFLVAGIYKYSKRPRLFWSMAIPIVLSLSTLTFMRNFAWKDDLTLWGDALKKAPALSRPYNNYAVALRNAGRLDEAIVTYNKVLAMPIEPFKSGQGEKLLALHNLPHVYVDKGEYQEALRRYEALIALYGEETEKGTFSLATVYFHMGNMFASSKDYDKALEFYQKALEIFPIGNRRLKSHTLTNLGWLLTLLERNDKAEKALKKAVRCNPGAAKAYIQLGNLYSKYPAKRAETVACYKRFLALEPRPPFRQELLAKISELESELDQEIISGDVTEDTHERIRRAYLSLIKPEIGDLDDYDPP
jgi:tetratricopeptide (TPR) repeat protein